MRKLLKIMENGVPCYREISKDEMLTMFDGMFNQFAHECTRKLSGYHGNVDEFEDHKQDAMIKASHIYDKYDISRNACFSKALHESFVNLLIDKLKEKEVQKRKCKNKMLYLNSTTESGDEVGTFIVDERSAVEEAVNYDNKMEEFLIKNLTDEQILCLVMQCKKDMSKSSDFHKNTLRRVIESLSEAIDGYVPDKKEELSTMLKISRPTLNKRIAETFKIVKELAEEYCLSNMELSEIPF